MLGWLFGEKLDYLSLEDTNETVYEFTFIDSVFGIDPRFAYLCSSFYSCEIPPCIDESVAKLFC